MCGLLRTYFLREGYQAGTQGAEDQHDQKGTENGKDLEEREEKSGDAKPLMAGVTLFRNRPPTVV